MGCKPQILLGLLMLLPGIAYGAEHIVPGDFATIQSAIDAAQPGDVIRINAGTYNEALTLKSDVQLEGAGWESTVIQCEPRSGAALFAYQVTNASVSGLSFQQLPLPDDSGPILFPYSAVMLIDSNARFTDCSIRNGAYHGAYLHGGASQFENVQFEGNVHSGVFVRDGDARPEFVKCAMRKNRGSGLVLIGPEVHVNARNCVMEDNDYYGIFFDGDATVLGLGNDFTRNGMINEDEIRYLWNTKDYTELEDLAARFRKDKTRFPSGEWQLGFYYEWLFSRGKFMSQEEEDAFLAQIGEWKAKFPVSITWRIVLAQAYYDRAWGHRGSGFSNTVSDESWRGYHAYMQKSWEVVDEAVSVKPQDPEYFSLRATLTMESPRAEAARPTSFVGAVIRMFMPSLTSDRERAPFLRGVAVEPLYYPLYYNRVRHLLPRWGGSRNAMLRFAERSADDTSELAGDTLYAVIATKVLQWEGQDGFLAYEFSWPRIQRGYETILETYPESSWRLNLYCWVACNQEDRAAATELFTRLNDYWDSDVWGTWKRYEAFRDWAAGGKPYPGPSPLETAVRDGDKRAVVRLLEADADPNESNLNGVPMIKLAIRNDELAILDRLLEAGADPDSKDSDGRFTIEFAVYEEDPGYLETLLKHGAKPDPAADARWTPLGMAISWERFHHVEPLLEAGANPDGGKRGLAYPLHEAVLKGRRELVRLLLDHGADVNLRGTDGTSILNTVVELQNVEIAKFLLSVGADPNLASETGWTPLFTAADVGNLELAKLLVEHGADFNAKEFDGWSIFHMATMSGATPVVEFLLERNPDGAFFVPDSGRTLLHQAAKSGHLDLARLFIERGVDVNAVETESGKTALQYAIDGGHDAIAALLREHGAE
jgi:ankyrin repeat protein